MLSVRSIEPCRRALAMVLTLGYFWLSVVLPFQHTHFHVAAVPLPATDGRTQTTHARPLDTKCSVQSQRRAPASCLACEWEAANVSPALPAFTLVLEKPLAPRVVTTFPRSLRYTLVSASSRAPPRA
ncbi:MAG TPA: hypothetical protein VKU00_18765 [Chthonomonadaceae bacterium]|nr:hypothetical protein [Chthonomonadaceae bacterium]